MFVFLQFSCFHELSCPQNYLNIKTIRTGKSFLSNIKVRKINKNAFWHGNITTSTVNLQIWCVLLDSGPVKFVFFVIILHNSNTSTGRQVSILGPMALLLRSFFYLLWEINQNNIFDTGLRNWEAEDDPEVEHARWSRNCLFMVQRRGKSFIDLVQLASRYESDVRPIIY